MAAPFGPSGPRPDVVVPGEATFRKVMVPPRTVWSTANRVASAGSNDTAPPPAVSAVAIVSSDAPAVDLSEARVPRSICLVPPTVASMYTCVPSGEYWAMVNWSAVLRLLVSWSNAPVVRFTSHTWEKWAGVPVRTFPTDVTSAFASSGETEIPKYTMCALSDEVALSLMTVLVERSIFDPAYRTLTKFFEQVGNYLASPGEILLAFSNLGDLDYLSELAARQGFTEEPVCSRRNDLLTFHVFRYRRSS